MSNGVLLSSAEAAGFQVLITTDQQIPFQQNVTARTIGIIIPCTENNRLSALRRLVADVRRALAEIRPGQVIRVSSRS